MERLSPKLICDICIEQDIQAREAIKIMANTLAHMLTYSNGSLKDRLDVMDHLCESIKNTMRKSDGLLSKQ